MENWIKFANLTLRLRDIDFFKEEHNRIECHWHHGMSYQITEEKFTDSGEKAKRIYDLQSLLGSQIHCDFKAF